MSHQVIPCNLLFLKLASDCTNITLKLTGPWIKAELTEFWARLLGRRKEGRRVKPGLCATMGLEKILKLIKLMIGSNITLKFMTAPCIRATLGCLKGQREGGGGSRWAVHLILFQQDLIGWAAHWVEFYLSRIRRSYPLGKAAAILYFPY